MLKMDSVFRRLSTDNVLGDLFRRVIQTLGTRVCLLLISIVSGIFVARVLGPAGRGEYAVASVVAATASQFVNLGLHSSNTHYLAKDRQLLPVLLGNSLLVGLGLAGTLGLCITLFSFIWPEHAPVQGLMVVLILFAVPLYTLFTLLQNLLLGLYETVLFNKVELYMGLGSLMLVLLFYLSDLASPASFYSSGLVVTCFVLFWMGWRLKKYGKEGIQVSIALLREHLSYSIKVYLSCLFAFLLVRADLLMIRYFLGQEETGLYAITVSLGDMLYMLPLATATILFPRLSAEACSVKRWQIAKKVALLIALFMAIAGMLAFPLIKPLVELFYGKAYLPAASAFQYLVPGIMFLSVNVIFMNYFGAEGNPPVVMLSPGLALLFNIMLNFFLIPQFGINGAALASSICYGFMLIVSLSYLRWWGNPTRKLKVFKSRVFS
ncbi:MAG: flippase [Desulfobulbaceae bacterium]|nr:flippase [Desulfobulbaceae bacterium]